MFHKEFLSPSLSLSELFESKLHAQRPVIPKHSSVCFWIQPYCGLNSVPSKFFSHLEPQNVVLFWNRLMELKVSTWDHLGLVWSLNPVDWCSYSKRKRQRGTWDIQRRRPCEDGSRDWSDAATGLGMAGIAGTLQKLGERHGAVLPPVFRSDLASRWC